MFYLSFGQGKEESDSSCGDSYKGDDAAEYDIGSYFNTSKVRGRLERANNPDTRGLQQTDINESYFQESFRGLRKKNNSSNSSLFKSAGHENEK